jgi:hypothetical protein
VFALNLKADRILHTKVDRVHFDQGLGIAEITAESMKSFCKRRHPDKYADFCKYVDEHPESLWLDFEQILTGMEKTEAYEALMQAAKVRGLESVMHKGFLTNLLVIHAMRSHEFMTYMTAESNLAALGQDKWEYFWILKNAWANGVTMARAVTPLAFSQWIFYRTLQHHFPLCDSPIMVGEKSVMAVISPRVLLEINLNVPAPEDRWIIRDGISASKYREFQRRSIRNSFKEIIFHDSKTLRMWRTLPEYKEQVRVLKTPETSKPLLSDAAARVSWLLEGMGRVPDDFDDWAHEFFNSPEST